MMVVSTKKAKGVNENVFETLTHSECKDVLLNKKCLSHLMNRIQSKNHRIGAYEISFWLLELIMRKQLF